MKHEYSKVKETSDGPVDIHTFTFGASEAELLLSILGEFERSMPKTISYIPEHQQVLNMRRELAKVVKPKRKHRKHL